MARRRRAAVHASRPRRSACRAPRLADLHRRRRRTTTPQALRGLLAGKTGAYRDIVLLNAAAAFLVADKVETLREGVELAAAVDRRRPRHGGAGPAGRGHQPRRMSDILDQIAAYKRDEVAARKRRAASQAEVEAARQGRLARRAASAPRWSAPHAPGPPGADRRDQEGLAVARA